METKIKIPYLLKIKGSSVQYRGRRENIPVVEDVLWSILWTASAVKNARLQIRRAYYVLFFKSLQLLLRRYGAGKRSTVALGYQHAKSMQFVDNFFLLKVYLRSTCSLYILVKVSLVF